MMRDYLKIRLPSAGNAGGARLGWLLGMCVMLMTALLPFSSYVAALPLIQSEWGIGSASAGVIFSAYLAGYAISALLVLPLTDRLPTRRVFLTSALITVVGNLLFPIAAFDAIVASALRFFAGIGLVGIYMPGLRIISQRFPNAGRGTAMGLYVTAFYTANAVSLLATGALMNHMDWRTAYLALSLISILTLPLVLLLVKNAREPEARSGGRLQLDVLRDSRSRKYIIGYSLHAMELYAVRVWLPVLLAAALAYRGADIERGRGYRRHGRGHRARNGLCRPGDGRSALRPFRAGLDRERYLHTQRDLQPRHRLDYSLALGADSGSGVRTGVGGLRRLFDIFHRVDRDRANRKIRVHDGCTSVLGIYGRDARTDIYWGNLGYLRWPHGVGRRVQRNRASVRSGGVVSYEG